MVDKRVIVVGAGAGGLMAAARAAEKGAEVRLLEKTARPGQKLLISGKTRCNLTNSREIDDFVSMFGPNGRFLYSAFSRYFREDLLRWLERYGVSTKVERGGRVFPASDKAGDVLAALERYLADNGVRVQVNTPVTAITTRAGRVTGVETGTGAYPAAAVILAAGGASYPGTGSSGDGYRLAEKLGHRIMPLFPALVPLVVQEVELARQMQGVSLRNVRLTAYQCASGDINPQAAPERDTGRGIPGKKPRPPVIESRMGEMMMTHFGIGGPVTLQMSLAVAKALENGPVSVSLDFKPALAYPELRERLQRDFDRNSQQHFRNILRGLLPQKLLDPFVEMSGIAPHTPGHQITSGEREKLLQLLKCLRFNIKSTLPMGSAMVTAGGVSLKEIDPRTMASRLVPGLFFCGEVMDIDAETGGYNLQAAFSTGYVAGEQSAALVSSDGI